MNSKADRAAESYAYPENGMSSLSLLNDIHLDRRAASLLNKNEPPSNEQNFAPSQFVKEHPLETVLLTSLATCAAVKLFPSLIGEGGPALRQCAENGLGGKSFAAAEGYKLYPNAQWAKQLDGTCHAEGMYSDLIKFPDGRVKETFWAGLRTEKTYLTDGSTETTWLNGLKQTHRNGELESIFPDGRKITTWQGSNFKAELPNGTVIEQDPELLVKIKKNNGVTMSHNPNGQSFMELPNGQSLTINPDGGRHLFFARDEKFYMIRPGSTNWEEVMYKEPGLKFRPADRRLPFTESDPVMRELNRLKHLNMAF